MTPVYIITAIACGIALGWIARALTMTRAQCGDEPTTVFGDTAHDHAPRDIIAKVSYCSVPNAHKRHRQMILAMDAAFFDHAVHFMRDMNRLAVSDYLKWPQTASALVLRERHVLETDRNYRQLLPYTIVRRKERRALRFGETRYLTYQRTNKVGEQRLAGKVSVGFGGHIDATSVCYTDSDSIDLGQTILDSAARERDEELRITKECQARWACPVEVKNLRLSWGDMFITQQSEPERMHLGIVMFLELPHHIELECAEEELTTIGMRTAVELLASELRGEIELEAWTRLFLADTLTEHERPTTRDYARAPAY